VILGGFIGGLVVIVLALMMFPVTPPSSGVSLPAGPPQPLREVSSREWQQIARDPDAHVGGRYVLYGVITQADAVTGTEAVRASVDGEKHEQSYEYPVNAILTSSGAGLSGLVVDDVVRAEVIVVGALEYETAMGGRLTAPRLAVEKVERLPETN
jgi:hypothetical protein